MFRGGIILFLVSAIFICPCDTYGYEGYGSDENRALVDTIKTRMVNVKNYNDNVLVLDDEWIIKVPLDRGSSDEIVPITEVANDIELTIYDGCSNLVYYDYAYTGSRMFRGYNVDDAILPKGMYYFRVQFRDNKTEQKKLMYGEILLLELN